MGHRKPGAFVLIVAAALSVLLLACGGDDDDGGAPTQVETPFGTSVVGALPDAFPADFPSFPDAYVIRGTDFGGRFLIEWRFDGPVSDVIDYYTGVLARPPFESTTVDVRSDSAVVEFAETTRDWTGLLGVSEAPDGFTRIFLNLVVE